MRARSKPSMLVRVSIHGIVNEIGSDTTVVQKGISLTWCTIASYGLAFTPWL